MKSILQVSLGILAAVGGFVDIGDLVFDVEAGSSFGYELLWAVVLGAVGIMVFSEMSGRVATVAKRPVFDCVRERLGARVGLATLLSTEVINILTCAAEVGGIALVLRLLTGLPYRPLIVVAAAIAALAIWLLPFEWIERVFGFGGLLLLAFTVAALSLGVDWGAFASGLVPQVDTQRTLLWAYFAIGLASSALMPYEIFFYSSGGVEEGWSAPKDLKLNRLTSIVGYGLGMFLSLSIIVVAAELFLPRGIQPQFIGTAALATQPLGQLGLLLGMLGILFAISGASIDTSLAGAYSLAQYFGWDWGKYRRPAGAPRFTLAWLGMLGIAVVVTMTGVDPIKITEYSVIFSAVALPFTFLPVLLVARDPNYMGEYANGRLGNFLGWFYLVVIVVIALTAIPLMILTGMGRG